MKKQDIMYIVILMFIIITSVLLTKFTSRETGSAIHLVEKEITLPINTEPIRDVGVCKPYAYYGASERVKDPKCTPEDLRCTIDPCR